MKKMEDMENRNNHKNQKTVKTAGAIFSESLKSLMPFFANNEKKGSRVKAHIAAMVAMLLIIGVGNAWGANETVTWSVSTSNANTISKDSGTLPTGASASMSSNDSQSDKSQLIKDKKQTFTLTGMDGCTIKGVTINMRKSNNGSSATVTVKVGSTTLQSGQSISLSTTAADKTVTLANTTTVVGTSENVVITVTAAKSSAYVLKYKVTYEASTKCATPTFSPAAGTYNNNQSVSINCATASATIRYTTNGSDPTESSATYSSPISVSGTTTIKAKAFKAGLTASDIATSTYTMVCATPTFSVAEGTYNNDQSVTLSCETEGAAIHYTIDGSDPTSSSPTYSSALSISSTQTLKAIAIKSGYTNSSIASAAYTMVCSNPTITLTAGTYNNDQSTTITTTTAGATIRYTLDGTTPTESSAVYSSAIAITSSKTLKAKVFKSGYTASSMVSAAYTLKCEQPSLSAETNTSIGSQDITITCGTTDAVIRYTLDGSDPTESSTIYSSAITFSTTKTLKARAFKSGYTKSDQKSGTYTIKCAVPTASPAAGTHSGPQDVELSTTYGDKIYYTLTEDGTAPGTPSESSTEYDGPIHMTVVTKIKAIAWKEGCSNSNQLGGSYGDTYTIQYNVTWMVDGEEWSDQGGSSTVNGGGHITTLPTAPTTGDFCGDRFMGWTDAEGGAYVHGSSGLYTTASGFPNATGDQVFYAVFADYAE